jgi:hypothetical protein
MCLPGDGALELCPVDAEPAHEALVEHDHPAARDRAHRELLVARNAQLPDDEDAERRAELLCHLVPDRDAAPWQGEHDHVVPAGVVAQALREQPSRFRPVTEASRLHLSESTYQLRRRGRQPAPRTLRPPPFALGCVKRRL